MADSRCRSGKGCVGKTSDGAAITARENTLCAACLQDLQRQLEALPHLAVALRTFLGGSMKVAYQSKVRATREPACPLNLRVDEILTDIGDVIDRCDGLRVADLIQQPAMLFKLWVGDEIRDRYLDGVDRALDVRRAHFRANKLIGLERVKQRRHAPCPDCGLPTLFNWVGGDSVECIDEECGFVASLTEYEIYCVELAGT